MFDSQKEKLFGKQSSFSQPTQPIPNPIRDRSGRLCSSDRSGQPDKHTVAIQDDLEVFHEAKTLNTDIETIREIIEEDIDFKIPGLPHSIVKQLHSASVRDSEIREPPVPTCFSTRLTTESIFSPESKQMIHEVGNIELCEVFDMEPKHNAKYVYHTRTSAASIARAGTSCEKEETKIRNSSSTRWTPFPDTVRSRESRNTTSPTSWRRSARRGTSRVSMTDLYEMNNSAVEWLKLVETKIFVDKWMFLQIKVIFLLQK